MLHLADGAQVGLEALLPEPGGELPVASIHRAQVLQVVCQRLPALTTACVMLRAPQVSSMCRPAFVKVFSWSSEECACPFLLSIMHPSPCTYALLNSTCMLHIRQDHGVQATIGPDPLEEWSFEWVTAEWAAQDEKRGNAHPPGVGLVS